MSVINSETISECGGDLRLPNILGLISVDKQKVLLNEVALKPLELTLNDIECCYQVVMRLTQDDQNYDMKADRRYR